MRVKYLLWKEKQKAKISDKKNENRGKAARRKWKRQAKRWEHEHPVR